MSGEQGVDKAKMKQYLVPAVGVAAIVLLVGLVIFVSGSDSRKMSDGSNGSADDPDLKDVSAGVKVRDVKEGAGEPCPKSAKAKVNTLVWLSDGSLLDDSKARGLPEAGKLTGWREGIAGMKPGGIRKLVVSGDKVRTIPGRTPIPPNSTVIMEVELVEVIPGPKLSDGTDPNAPDPGLKDLGGGLKMRDIRVGIGEPVPEGARVTIHYVGWLTDGTVFDSSREKNEPATFALGGLIQGWQKGIPGMKPGGIRKLVIPPDLAYGPQDKGDIPPNSTLVFEVELLK